MVRQSANNINKTGIKTRIAIPHYAKIRLSPSKDTMHVVRIELAVSHWWWLNSSAGDQHDGVYEQGKW